MPSDDLPSWNDGTARSAILDFVARVTKDGGPDYVPPSERIAVFDNDGTLWCEQPLQPQVYFLIDRVHQLAAEDPAMSQQQPFKAVLERDLKTLHNLGKKGLLELAFATHAGMSDEEFDLMARDWLATAKHPKLGRLYKHLTYRPQIELLGYLRENGFKTFIVSGGGIDMIRAFSEEAYEIPREQVIGSSVKTRFEIQGDRIGLTKLAELSSFDDREVKVENIGLHIGRRPILAFGNSDGDLAMMRYTLAGQGARLALLVHHDDAEREFAYDRKSHIGTLDKAWDEAVAKGWTLVSMKNDWAQIYPPVK